MTSGIRLSDVNHIFFKSWNSDMVYILGFTCADGCVYGRTLSWELSNKFESDKLLLERFNRELSSNYQIEERLHSFRLRLNSVLLVDSLKEYGIVPNKTKTLTFPKVPDAFLKHFIRGFFDGDGWISLRKEPGNKEINVGFVNGSKAFIEVLVNHLTEKTSVRNFNLRTRKKTTKKGVESIYYSVEFYSQNAYEIIRYLFDDLTPNDLFLTRKYEKQLVARKLFEESRKISSLGRKWVTIENNGDMDVRDELIRMFAQENMLPRDIALKLGISLATAYRWLEKIHLRIPVERTN